MKMRLRMQRLSAAALSALWLYSGLCAADAAVAPSVFLSRDSEGNQIEKYSVSQLWHVGNPAPVATNQDLGVMYTRSRYLNATGYDEQGDAISITVDSRNHKTWAMGHAGVGRLDGKTYAVGDLSAMHFFGQRAIVSGGVFADIVDSPEGLNEQITVGGYHVGFEAYGKRAGASVSLKHSFFSDNNQRAGVTVRPYYQLGKGFYAYGRWSQYGFSDPSEFYWSPSRFDRYDVGIGYRQRVHDVWIRAHVDTGQTKVFSESSNVYSWQFSAESDQAKPISVRFTLGQDLNAFNYRYRYASGEVRVKLP